MLPVLTEMSIPSDSYSDSTSSDTESLITIVRLNTETKANSSSKEYCCVSTSSSYDIHNVLE